MLRGVRQCVMIGVAFAFLAVAPADAANGDFSPAEKATMRAYNLTAQKVEAYIAATNALAAAKKSDPSVARELEAIENELNDTLAQFRTAITRHPKIFAPFQRQGLSVDDTIMIPFVITFASAAAVSNNAGPFADMINPAQLAVLKANPNLAPRLQQAMEALEEKDRDPQDNGDPQDADAK
jgi:hypothetical protein